MKIILDGKEYSVNDNTFGQIVTFVTNQITSLYARANSSQKMTAKAITRSILYAMEGSAKVPDELRAEIRPGNNDPAIHLLAFILKYGLMVSKDAEIEFECNGNREIIAITPKSAYTGESGG